ncbi:unnamed protein product [Rotaria sp. Silwood2]|nr:unnamed protein product [Rotaria sp. Silwood2]
MEYSCVGLNDLPDEILMIILKKLNNLEVLYSLQGVNQRLNKMVHDSIFAGRLTFVKWFSHNFIDLFCCNMVLDRFCLQILPEIHGKIKWLDLEASSMKHVLRVTDYPNLHTLGLYNINEELAQCLFTDETLSCGVFKNQITTLLLTIGNNMEAVDTVVNICDYILNVFTNLIYLILYESSYKNRVPLFFDDPPPPTFRSSTLLKLSVRLKCFGDCLYLLDGRFNQLHTLYVVLVNLHRTELSEKEGDLPNLKCFSLSCNLETSHHDEIIFPLLNRMPNLEQLGLYLLIHVDEIFIDGNHLKKNIINRMPRLNQFTFYISSSMFTRNKLNLPSTEDIQRTFIDFPNNEIVSYVDYFPKAERGLCHIYSYPSVMECYSDISNNFPGGLFNYVRMVSLFDEHPFEHEFFLRIVQSFPFMEKLCLINYKPQTCKQFYESNNDNRNLSVIEYSFLSELVIVHVHDDYIEQFLFNTKTYLPYNIILHVNYESLQRVTNYFKRDATRINCAKINKLNLGGESKCSNSLEQYFPYAEISYSIIY